MAPVRFGTGRAPGSVLLLTVPLVAAVVAAPSVADHPLAEHRTAVISGAVGDGARASQGTAILTIEGTNAGGTVNAFIGPTGRLTVASPQGMTSPPGVSQCTQDSPTQLSCDPGFIGAITARLLGGNDTFAASASLPVVVGTVVNGQPRPLNGGTGRDRILGGARGDFIAGRAGKDRLFGRGAQDALFGGKGADKLNGGRARDICSGGAGRDAAKRCELRRKIP